MDGPDRGVAVVAVSALAAAYLLSLKYPLSWILAMSSAGLAYGALSSVLHARGLLFMAGAAPHVALASASVSALFFSGLGLWWLSSSILLGVVIIVTTGYLVYKGLNADIAAGFLVSLSSTIAVLALYRVSVSGGEVIGLIIGDPLLTNPGEALLLLAMAATLLAIFATHGWRLVYLGLLREESLLGTARGLLWDLSLYLVLGVVTVGMLRIVGFVLEHVLLILPGIVASHIVKGWRKGLLTSAVIGLSASIAGLAIAVVLDISPSGASGAILVLLFLYTRILRGG